MVNTNEVTFNDIPGDLSRSAELEVLTTFKQNLRKNGITEDTAFRPGNQEGVQAAYVDTMAEMFSYDMTRRQSYRLRKYFTTMTQAALVARLVDARKHYRTSVEYVTV